ncbi:MAG: hypothetical protein JRI59_08075, partial [Deltaproteobacteria bacterium]|nr:hypothetical protein [Deltaproteobacteria bacterium]
AIGTGGASPALARHLREELEEHFGPEYGPYLTLLGLVREKVLELRRGHPDNAALFHRLVACPLRQAIRDGDRQKTLQLLEMGQPPLRGSGTLIYGYLFCLCHSGCLLSGQRPVPGLFSGSAG